MDESRWTQAVMRWLQMERPHTFESVGYMFVMSSTTESDYTEAAKRWLRDHSELSTHCIEKADYSVPFQYFKGNPD